MTNNNRKKRKTKMEREKCVQFVSEKKIHFEEMPRKNF